MKTAAFFTLGCKVNQCDTEALEEAFRNDGYMIVDFESKADVYVINTCTVTAISDKKSRQMLSHARRTNPDAIICATGCYVQRAGNEIAALPSVDIVLTPEERHQIIKKVNDIQKDRKIDHESNSINKEHFEETGVFKTQGRTRAFIKIQEGCNHFCSYCIVPHVRGRERSQDIESILAEAKRAADKGCREIVLTGIQLSSYGRDLGYQEGLIQLAERLSDIQGIARIRFGSLEMEILTEAFINRMALLPKVCRHYHIPLQSGSDTVLYRMNRHYTTAEFARKIELLRTIIPEAAITTDIMAGFPGETDEEFNASLNFVKQIRFNKMHVFPYSKREGTPAAGMPEQIAKKLREERASQLLAIGCSIEKEYLEELLGTTQNILVEECCDGIINGHTDRYVFVKARGNVPVNHFAAVSINGVESASITGNAVPSKPGNT